ncbi:MAG: CsbD family protein [Thioalkalivibrio sp.]|nr:CsbD family protein [Thioalkalivibrio sp.]
MDKDQVKGRVEEAKGKVKQVAGKAVSNKELEHEGSIQKAGGKIQAGYGDLKEDIKDST